ncbi:hypothetical protein KPL70_000574 [Citrus sinensis]|uniref:Uncharacterized protein n=3 Tax=Citrus TaxID=2706 RepID=A0ACB8NR18_CITSI|nr:uncharacterized protein LOC18054511 isoform X1 [Citrus x clementina]XP_006475851.1 uncharacterized protein LOC102606763 isoform X1 [Citrus sinensis]GAY63229.1 hypothetical protein CUMW_223940 [Citrus unshiu]ESR64161.1 hypothetical protein CICLE_v10009673mg [Citrus x clementina]KAH9761807.1 hypothetical protein KPL70_000574 [Citrus sinensis]KAH9800196.1 hypothetical protein KPL71_000572 [Citrus sinensis]
MVTPYTWIDHFLACMGGCFGCCTKSTPIIAVDEPTKGLRIQGRAVKKPSISDDFWSTSTCDLENSAVQSQRSISSISTSNQTLNHCSGTSSNSDFVNHGLILWNQVRMQWIGSSKSENRTQQSWESKSSTLDFLALSSWPATYESLLGTKNPFPRPIPLSEMVDLLVDVWEHEGLYD